MFLIMLYFERENVCKRWNEILFLRVFNVRIIWKVYVWVYEWGVWRFGDVVWYVLWSFFIEFWIKDYKKWWRKFLEFG